MNRKSVLIVIVLILAVTVQTAWAQLPVFDFTNYLNALQRYFQLQQQLKQLVQSYNQLILEYKQMLWMARRLPDLDTQKFVSTDWLSSRSANTYGSTTGWTQAINRGAAAAAGYLQAVDRLLAYGAAFGRIPADQLERVKADYATAELTDAANIHTMEVVGFQRAKSRAAEAAIAALESATLSTRDEWNTEIAVLNKINATDMMALRSGQETNQLLVSLLEQTVTEAKARRDAGVRAINADIAIRLNALDAGMEGVRGTTQAITTFIMP